MNKPIVRLVNEDGNAFVILGKVTKALKKAGYTKEQVAEYVAEATSGSYSDLLAVTNEWVEIE